MRGTNQLAAAFAVAAAIGVQAQADTFGSGENAFEIPFVRIGDAGNAADTTGAPNPAGAVDYVYRIGKFEIPEHAIRRANAITAGSDNPLDITIDERGPNKPATRVSWFEAAWFVNFLNEAKGFTPAYKFDEQGAFQLWEAGDAGFNPDNQFRNRHARYFLPSVDEWYKAAFYDPLTDQYFDFPNGSDEPPMAVVSGTDPNTAVYNQAGPADVMQAGGESPFGTVAQAGNVWEWEETAFDRLNDSSTESHGVRGSSHVFTASGFTLSSSFRGPTQASSSIGDIGFRVASVPEPSSMLLIIAVVYIAALPRCERH